MTALLVVTVFLLLALLPRLLPQPVRVAPAGQLPAVPAPLPASALLSQAARPDNLLYLPLGLHPADRQVHGAVEVAGLLRVRPPLRFWSLSANEIRFGDCARAPCGARVVRAEERRTEEGEFRLAAGTCISCNLTVHGDLYLGRYSSVKGSLQVDGGVWMDEGVEVAGAIVARGSVRVGQRARVAGPLTVGRNLSLARDCVIGSAEAPTRISAKSMRIVEGCRVHGCISADDGAQVKALARVEELVEPL